MASTRVPNPDRFIRRSRYGESTHTVSDSAGRAVVRCHTYSSVSNASNPVNYPIPAGPPLTTRYQTTVGYLVI